MARTLRRWIIEQSLASNVGHIGSALGIADVMAALWGGVMRDPGSSGPERDRFVLGKGHAALALYGALRWRGIIDEATFRTYCGEGSRLGVHPEHGLPGIDVSTGSLGQGLSVGCGIALALRRRGSEAQVFAVLSDAECNEGQVWEAAMFAAHHRLGNVRVVVDVNGLQALGHTRDVIDLGPRQRAAWRAMGWEADEVDGHDVGALTDALSFRGGDRPRALMARTVLGKGVPFMEDRLEWHYRNLTPELAADALRHLEAGG